MMNGLKRAAHTLGILGLALAISQTALAAPIDVTLVGTWDSVGSGNPTGTDGPGLAPGQRYVIRLTYDDLSTVTDDVAVLTAFFTDSGEDISTVDLTDAGNSLDIFVPMEGLDGGSPFIYTQDETDHFPAFIATPTLNFVEGSDISDPGNIIGLEYEGNFDGASFNVIELFNTAPAGGPINMVSQILNCGNASCTASGIASTDTNGLATAVDVVVTAGADVVYDAASLTQTATASLTQSNDLGAGRSDGEDFVDTSWSQAGVASGDDIDVAIADSGLTTTTDSTSWTVTMSEQMTLESDTDTVLVSYLNALPTASASAVATATGTDFTLTAGDVDLMVNNLIAGFESLTVSALVDGTIDATAFFAGLIGGGAQSNTHAELEALFGLGPHTVVFTATDLAGASAIADANFDVLDTGVPPAVPEPGTIVLMMLGLLGLRTARRRSMIINRS